MQPLSVLRAKGITATAPGLLNDSSQERCNENSKKPNFLDMQFIRSIKVERSLEILVILEVSRVIENFKLFI